MSVLTRGSLEDGSYASRVGLPAGLVWSPAQLEESFQVTMRDRPEGDTWVFAYGSLMWNPLLHVAERENAILDGWHRSFCLMSVAGRGSVDIPGRMLALEEGGRVEGVALRLTGETALRELRVLWAREMASGSYIPRWERVALPGGRNVQALVFVANTSHNFYNERTSAEVVAPLIARAVGTFGTNVEYLCRLADSLAQAGLSDAYVDTLVDRLKASDPATAQN